MKTLTINPGSTSIKYSLFDWKKKIISLRFKKRGDQYFLEEKRISKKDYQKSFAYLLKVLKKQGLINDFNDIEKFGIRIVHGGEVFQETTKIDRANFRKLKKLSELAPLHNPPALNAISQIRKKSRKAEIWGVFDTTFHKNLPDFVSTYAIPRRLREKYHVKKYGFHGVACQSILRQIKKEKEKLPKNIIIVHLGGGASVTAIKCGKSIETSMGFTPLEGLMMTTRSGDLDPGIYHYIGKKFRLSNNKVIEVLNKKSGIYGITGIKSMKTVVDKAIKGDKWCGLAINMFVHRVVKYVSAYYGVLQGMDMLVFSGGIGEGSSELRERIIQDLEIFGLKISPLKNKKVLYATGEISPNGTRAKVFVVKAEEDKEILLEILKKS